MAVAKNITNATNAAPIVVTATAHGFVTNDLVTVASVGGNTAANGSWFVTKIDADGFSIPANGNANYTSGGTATKITVDPSSVVDGSIIIKHETTTTGTGSITVGAIVSGYAPITMLEDGDSVGYRVDTVDGSDIPTGTYEVGVGVYNKSAGTVSRDSVTENDGDDYGADLFPSKVDFSAGTKTITVYLAADPDRGISPGGKTSLSDDLFTSSPSVPDSVCYGVLVGAGAGSNSYDISRPYRQGSVRNTYIRCPEVYLVPVQGLPNRILLWYATTTMVATTGGAVAQNVSGFFSVPISAGILPRSIVGGDAEISGTPYMNIDSASRIPFSYNAAKLTAQDHAYALTEFDIFAYAADSDTGLAAKIFFLNWGGTASRNNGDAGSPKGHEIYTDAQGWTYLDTQSESGWSSSWITDDRFGMKDKRRYLYLGTMVGDRDSTVTNMPGFRGVWNKFVGDSYLDARDFSALGSWGVDPQQEGADYLCPPELLLSSRADPWNRQWVHYWLNPLGREADVPLASMAITTYGNVRVGIDGWDGSTYSSLLTPLGAVALTADVSSRRDRSFTNCKLRQISAGVYRKGLNCYMCRQRPGLLDDNLPKALFAAGVLSSAVNGQNVNLGSLSGPCRFSVAGRT